MNFNTYQPSSGNKLLTVPQKQNNVILNPALHYHSDYLKNLPRKSAEISSANINPPSSMKSNFLNVTPKYAPQKISPYHAQTKDHNYKTSEISTAKSMVFMGTEKPSISTFNPKKSYGGLGKLQSMARTANKNFDDSKDFEGPQHIKSQKPASYLSTFQAQKPANNPTKYGNTLQTQSKFVNNNFLSPTAYNSPNFLRQNEEKNNTYKSFIHDNGSSSGQKVGGLDFLMKFKREQQQKKLQRQSQNVILNQQNNKIQHSARKNSTNQISQQSAQNETHCKLFHQLSAPNLGHLQKTHHHYEPVNILNNHKNTIQSNSYQNQIQFQLHKPVSKNDKQLGPYKVSNFNMNAPHSTTFNNHEFNNISANKLSSKQQKQQGPSQTFMKKFSSDRADNRANQQKNFPTNSYVSPQNFSSFGKKLNFNDKQSEQSPATTEQNTPVKEKQKLVVTPAFFKNRQNKVFSEPMVQDISKITVDSKLNGKYDRKSQSPTNIKSTLSEDGSNDSLEYMNDDFISEPDKEWSLNDFELGDKLGKGAFGDVFIARQKHLGLMCVLKKMSKKRIKEQQRQQHVIRQLKIQIYLNHKHLTSMYGYFHDKDNIYLIMQYLPDGNLSQIKRRKKTSQKQTAQIVKQVCEGLSYMHQRSVIHRDIKPQNIFVNQAYIKLGDFGCSIFTDGLRKTVVSCLEYSSPQQLGNGYYNEKIDVWGVGILAFQLLTGKSPFQNQIMNMAQGMTQINFKDLKFPQALNLSDLAKDFVSCLLNVDPVDRIDIHQALQHKFISTNVKDLAHLQ